MERVIKPSLLNKLILDKDHNEAQMNKIKRFFVKVPNQLAHPNHLNGEVCGIGNAVHPLLVRKIHDLVAAGRIN